ncbi:hypothetical protein TDB9533_01949 [Thalassocella blandensis]|nr:hypothetical protein TDB9533_01949 [Thalassocella blandensis]
MNKELFECAGDGSLDTIKQLNADGVDVLSEKDESGNTPLMVASCWGHLNVVEYLLDMGANIEEKNKNGLAPIVFACQSGMHEVAELLLRRGADNRVLNADGESLLMVASMQGNLDTIKVLLDSGLDASYQDDAGYTAAMYTAFNRDKISGVDILKLLIEKGADINVRSNEGKSLEDYAKDTGSQLISSYIRAIS